MVVTREINPAFQAQPDSEALRVEQNSFAHFLDENNEAFDRHSFLTYELRDEEAGWKNSPTLDSVVEKGLEVMYDSYPQLNTAKSKTVRRLKGELIKNFTRFIFSNTSEKDSIDAKILPLGLSAQRRIAPQRNGLMETLGESIEDFRTSFRDAILPLVSGIRESKAELMEKFEAFLLSNPSNIIAFGDFLSDKKNNAAKLEAIRPFLSSLVESERNLTRDKKEGTLRRAAKKWTDELKEKPTHATIDEFTATLESRSPNIHEWLAFAAQGVDIASFLKSRPDVSLWTTELREALFSFVSSRYTTACSSIEKELEGFRRPFVSKTMLPRVDLELGNAKRRIGKVEVKKEPDDVEGASETVKKARYPIGILTKEAGSSSEIRFLTEEAWAQRLEKEADSIDPADRRMIADLKTITLSLQEDPYGLGTKKLNARTVAVKNRRLPLRRIYPHKRIGLPLDYQGSHDIRIVYVIDRGGEVPVIGIEGIYKHGDYDKKF